MKSQNSIKRLEIKMQELDFECEYFHNKYKETKKEYENKPTLVNLKELYFAVTMYLDVLQKLKDAQTAFINAPENEFILEDWLLKRN